MQNYLFYVLIDINDFTCLSQTFRWYCAAFKAFYLSNVVCRWHSTVRSWNIVKILEQAEKDWASSTKETITDTDSDREIFSQIRKLMCYLHASLNKNKKVIAAIAFEHRRASHSKHLSYFLYHIANTINGVLKIWKKRNFVENWIWIYLLWRLTL